MFPPDPNLTTWVDGALSCHGPPLPMLLLIPALFRLQADDPEE
jgi:hypothetical protein